MKDPNDTKATGDLLEMTAGGDKQPKASKKAAEPAVEQPPEPNDEAPQKIVVLRHRLVRRMNPVSAQFIEHFGVEEEERDELPESVTLAAPYAFYDDNGALHNWHQGQVVTDPEQVALLISRGVIFEDD